MSHPKRYTIQCFPHGFAKEDAKGIWVGFDDYEALAAENERLIKAGDAMCRLITSELHNKNGVHKMLLSWLDAAKEGRDAK